MLSSKCKVFISLLAGVLVALPAAASAAERSVPGQGLTDVVIHLGSGDLQVAGWDEPRVRVEWSDSSEPPPALTTTAGRLEIGRAGEGNRGLSLDLKVGLPRGLRLEVRAISGDVQASGLEAGCQVKAVSGDVRLERVSGGARVTTVSGDVRLEAVRGDLGVKTVSGGVRAGGLEGGLCEIKTVSGRVELHGSLGKVRLNSHSGDLRLQGSLAADGGLRARTFSGDLSLALPARSGFDLDAQSRSGEVRLEGFALEAAERRANQVRGRVGQGGPALELGSFSGDISIRPLD